ARALHRRPHTRGARPCTGGGAGSRSRASRPVAAHRRPDGAASLSRSPPPDDERAAQAEPTRAGGGDPRVPPGVEQARLGPAFVEAADARAEEAAYLPPAGRDDGSRSRQPDTYVEVPERPPDSVREAELEHRDGAAGPNDPDELAKRRGHVVDIAEEIGE